MPPRSATFGDLLRQYRLAAGLTQEGLAERAGLSVHGIQKLERGATHPYRDTAQRLIAALHLEADDRSRLQAAVAPVRRHGSAARGETRADVQHNLPVPTTSLIGREQATREVTRRLAETRLLTLTGVGGCGKTRLELEVARALVDDYADGVWLVELGPLVDPALVRPRVAAVLGVRETAEQPLTSALRHRTLLLVLDNCEHLLDACAQLVDGLLRACPGLRVLATSREPIGISGEVAWRVPSLALPEADSAYSPEQLLLNPAVQLLLQRATAAQPRFALTARNASAVVQISRRLDGIPLALELAAARTEALSAEQIAARLDQRFRLLTGGSRAALPRQQTLAATLDWSYDLLTPPERRLFERLAVFSGGWTLEAAEAVCASGAVEHDDVLELLARLTRKSLVVAEESADAEERYSMLETVRDYARQKLARRGAAEIRALRGRHAGFYASLVEQLDPQTQRSVPTPGSQTVDPRGRLDAELDNVRSVLTWWLESEQPAPGIKLAIRLLFFWEARGLYAEARRWLGALLELAERPVRASGHQPLDGSSGGADASALAERASAIAIIATCALRQGEYQEARTRHDEAIAIQRELGEALPLAISLAERGLVAWILGDPAEAVDYLEESRRVFERCDRTPVAVALATNALRNLGMVARSRGDYVRATEYFRESVIQARALTVGGGYSIARGLCHLARTVFLHGDVPGARQLFGEALGVMQAERLAGHSVAECLDWLAAAVDASGRPRDAAVLFGAADAHWQASGAIRYAPERAAFAAELSRVQAALAADEFAAAWAAGRTMAREQAISYALERSRG